MKKQLDLNYWTSKFDDATDADYASIEDALKYSAMSGRNGFTDREKLILAQILLCGCRIFSDKDDYSEAFKVCTRFNQEYSADCLFYSDNLRVIKVWRYNYRGFLKSIPDLIARNAIYAIYTRLGYQLTEDDVLKIGCSNNIYDYFLSEIKREAGERYITSDAVDDYGQRINACYLNMYIHFDKLGFEGMNPYEVFASIGELAPAVSIYKFKEGSRDFYGMRREARDRSRGRVYPSVYEMITIMEL